MYRLKKMKEKLKKSFIGDMRLKALKKKVNEKSK